MKKKKTKQELHEEGKKEMGEALDYLKQVDRLRDESSRKYVIEKEVERVKGEEKGRHDIKNALSNQKHAKFTYRRRLAIYAQTSLATIDFPAGWEYYGVPTDGKQVRIFGKWFASKEGILVIVRSPQGEVYIRGILCTMNPEYDVKAIDILVIQAENTLDSAKGLLLSDNRDTVSGLRKTKGGVILPN